MLKGGEKSIKINFLREEKEVLFGWEVGKYVSFTKQHRLHLQRSSR